MDKSFSKMKSFPYNGAFDFDDGADSNVEYTYNANGQLTSDANSGISLIQYDMLGNPKKVTMASGDYIEYVYAPDGTKLKASHYTKRTNNTYSCLNTFYRGNMILESNCANLVQNSLDAIGKDIGEPHFKLGQTPGSLIGGFVGSVLGIPTTGNMVGSLIEDKTPNLIYKRIKQRNNGTTIK